MIKPFNLRDVFLVANLQKQGTALDLEERLLHPRSPLRSALLANLFPTIPGVSTYILNINNDTETHLGLAQARTRPGRPEQDVVFLAPALEIGNGSHAIWQRLLNHLCIKAGEAGYQRMYVRLAATSDALQIFRNVGFTAYAEERIFRLDAELHPLQPQNTLGLRRQISTDSWSLQRLYTAVTPHTVQSAEGLAQGQWQINNYPLADRGYRHGFVWVNRGEIMAVINVHSGKAGHWFRLMVHPDARSETTNLILGGLSLLKNPQHQPVFCSLRTYQLELTTHLLACGFRQFSTESIMVKHITVRAKDFLTRLLPAFDSTVEAKHAAPTTMLHAETPVTKSNNPG